jgi:hypothetical protein
MENANTDAIAIICASSLLLGFCVLKDIVKNFNVLNDSVNDSVNDLVSVWLGGSPRIKVTEKELESYLKEYIKNPKYFREPESIRGAVKAVNETQLWPWFCAYKGKVLTHPNYTHVFRQSFERITGQIDLYDSGWFYDTIKCLQDIAKTVVLKKYPNMELPIDNPVEETCTYFPDLNIKPYEGPIVIQEDENTIWPKGSFLQGKPVTKVYEDKMIEVCTLTEHISKEDLSKDPEKWNSRWYIHLKDPAFKKGLVFKENPNASPITNLGFDLRKTISMTRDC